MGEFEEEEDGMMVKLSGEEGEGVVIEEEEVMIWEF